MVVAPASSRALLRPAGRERPSCRSPQSVSKCKPRPTWMPTKGLCRTRKGTTRAGALFLADTEEFLKSLGMHMRESGQPPREGGERAHPRAACGICPRPGSSHEWPPTETPRSNSRFVPDVRAIEAGGSTGSVMVCVQGTGLFEVGWAPDGLVTFMWGEPVQEGKRHVT